QEYLALMYLEGRGIARDVRKGTEMLTKVANGSKSASLKLADAYWSGKLVPQDYKQALKRYTAASDTGDPHALYMLATAHRDGAGVSKNNDSACMYYVLALSIGSPEALHDSPQAWCPAATLGNGRERAKKWLQRHPPVAWIVQQRRRDQQNSNNKGVERQTLSDPAKQ
ncbi:MAG TPA: tetratricopeptide repeat protein, partial [Terriglobales bacterium]|nr:tetratricopeptide repeat protein [Terriglobales bacterium]